MKKNEQQYKIEGPYNSVEEFKSPSDGAALSKCLDAALMSDKTGTWTVSFKGAAKDEPLHKIVKDDTGIVVILDV